MIPFYLFPKVLQIFLRTIHNENQPYALQDFSVRVISSLIDTIYNKEDESIQTTRSLLSKIYLNLVERLEALRVEIPEVVSVAKAKENKENFLKILAENENGKKSNKFDEIVLLCYKNKALYATHNIFLLPLSKVPYGA